MPAKQDLELVTEPRAKREARSVLYCLASTTCTFCEHDIVLLIDDHAYLPYYPMIVTTYLYFFTIR